MQPDNPVVAGTVLRRPAIQSPNYVTGSVGWTINADGSAEFNNVVIRNGTIESGTALFYNGTPAAGKLVASISATAGTDTFGNTYPAGFAMIDTTGIGSEVFLTLDNTLGAQIQVYPAGGAASWTPATIWGLKSSSTLASLVLHPPVPAGGNQFGQIAIVGGDGVSASTSRVIIESGVNAGEIDLKTATVISAPIVFDTDGNSTAETWHTPTLLNSFTAGGPPSLQYRKLASPPNCVQVCGTIISGATTGSGTAIATLPTGYRPATNTIVLPVNNASTSANLWLGLQSNGSLALHGTWANGATIQINGMYPIDL